MARRQSGNLPTAPDCILATALLLAGGEQRIELLLEGVIADAVVEFGTSLHQLDHVLLVAVLADRGVDRLGCLVGINKRLGKFLDFPTQRVLGSLFGKRQDMLG